MRRAAKVDRNQGEIVSALRDAGYSVAITSTVGGGFPDLVVGLPGAPMNRRNLLLEVKDGELCASAQALTPDQVKFHVSWAGQVDIVRSVGEALTLAKLMGDA